MNYVLFDDNTRNHLLPLTFTRPVADLRIGILTIREKWEKLLKEKTSTLTDDYLSKKYPVVTAKGTVLINGSILPTAELIKKIKRLDENESLVSDECVIAQHINTENLDTSIEQDSEKINPIKLKGKYIKVNYTWDIFAKNGQAILDDFPLATRGRSSQRPNSTNTVIGS